MNDDVRDAVKQWRVKAESDWISIEILQTSEQCPPDVVCFHCQQFIEKLLNADALDMRPGVGDCPAKRH